MFLSRAAVSRCLLATGLLLSAQSQAELSANIGATTEFVRDGISQTRGNPALQAGLTLRHNSGLYGGLWTSGVDRREDSADYEQDAFAGIYLPLGDTLALDLSATRYTWSGDTEINGQAYTEGGLRLLINDALTLGWRESGSYLGSHFDKRSLELGYTLQLSEFSLEFFTAQHRWLEVDDDYNFGENGNRDSYWQFRVGVDRSYGPWDFSLTLNRTNLTSQFDAGTILQFGVQRYFNLW